MIAWAKGDVYKDQYQQCFLTIERENVDRYNGNQDIDILFDDKKPLSDGTQPYNTDYKNTLDEIQGTAAVAGGPAGRALALLR